MSVTSYYDVFHEGGPLGGQQLQYKGEPSLRLSKHGGDYVRERVRSEDDTPLREYRYHWEPADHDGVQRVPQDGDDASAMLERGPVVLPEGASMTVPTPAPVEDEGGSETGNKQATASTPATKASTRTPAKGAKG